MKNSPDFIRIPARGWDDEDELELFFAEVIGDDGRGPLAPALDLMVDPHDVRMTVDKVEITSVYFDSQRNEVQIEYVVTASAYYGCRDQDNSDEYEGSAEGNLVGGEWVFPRHVYPEPQSPDEEL
ncbi:MAG: hypothetical protein EOP24_31970 [Hyphomicrobiales bacterium]|nr:MAG: hypothetical protein EOP24_31970 [Hyphomicrobiales bacterium]